MPVTTHRTARSASALVRAALPAALAASVVAAGVAATASACTTHPARPAARATHTAHAVHPSSHAAAVPSRPPRAARVPAYAHIVVVIEENHSYPEIIGSAQAPYINALGRQGALFTSSHAVSHPSEPNYLALFAGSTFGIAGDPCPVSESGASLGSELAAAGLSYASYSESMPAPGYQGCSSGEYARKHNPVANFTGLPATMNDTFAQFPTDYAKLPTVSFVDPNLLDDMHDGTIMQGDSWLKTHVSRYVRWATAHNSLLIVTWDEDDGSAGNQVATIFAGAHVRPGRYGENITHYNVLRTIEQAYGLKPLRNAAAASPITGVFR
jgi:acid phosphatase